MKRFASVLLAVVLMLSLSVFAFATPFMEDITPSDSGYISPYDGIMPYSLIPMANGISILTAVSNNTKGTFTSLVDDGTGLYVGSGAILTQINTDPIYNNLFYIGRNDAIPVNSPSYWWNFIGKITDANGYVLQASDFNNFGVRMVSTSGNMTQNVGHVSPASDNCYQFSDGYIQIAVAEEDGWSYSNTYGFLYCNVSNSSVVAPLSFEVEKFEIYSGESSSASHPFPFGSGAHSTTPPAPEVRDPNDASQYGTAQDQVQWYNDAFGGAVDPELDNKINAGNDMLLQQEEIEQDVIADFQQYSSQVDPANITFPTAVLNGMSFIGSTFMSSYNNLGDISFIISLSMMIGVVLALIGRGEGALAREKANSRYERRRDENRAYYEQMRNKK